MQTTCCSAFELVSRAQLETRNAVTVDGDEVQPVRRNLDRDPLYRVAVAPGEQRRLPPNLGEVVDGCHRQPTRRLLARRLSRQRFEQL
jgi:hypothetical protein